MIEDSVIWDGKDEVMTNTKVYDSSQKSGIFSYCFTSLWRYRSLIYTLVERDIKVRYRGSLLGFLWSFLNPLLMSLVLWVVFVTVFRAKLIDGTQFAPYVLSGVLIINFFSQGILQVADSIARGSEILLKIYVPPQVLAVASALSNAINFIFGLLALAFVSIASGSGMSWKFPFSLFVILCMTLLITGIGLFLANLFIRYEDTRNIVALITTTMMYLAPVFYPKGILNEIVKVVVNLNPLTSFLDVFRHLFSNIGVITIFDFLYMSLVSMVVFMFGVAQFSKKWPRSAAML